LPVPTTLLPSFNIIEPEKIKIKKKKMIETLEQKKITREHVNT
jgi:hypothetical protein